MLVLWGFCEVKLSVKGNRDVCWLFDFRKIVYSSFLGFLGGGFSFYFVFIDFDVWLSDWGFDFILCLCFLEFGLFVEKDVRLC